MATPGRIDQPNDINLTGGATIGPPAAVNAGKVSGVAVDLSGIADGDAVVYDGATSTLKPGAGTGAGLDLTGRAHGDVLWVDTSGDAPVPAWLSIPADWATESYVLGIAFGRPAWRTAGGVEPDPVAFTVDATHVHADSTAYTADQTETT